ncbi:glycerate kinase [Sungkyunkwania multivorans]|uniref:Glycerate kinase n=1 Tax=Sungkyunkwania multivorans TaxID=1173618 RepID=A0ABW3CX15_9FLAO
MNILIIPDKFKGSLSAIAVINAIKKGIAQVDNSIRTFEVIASDGGDGFLEAISSTLEVETISLNTRDPLGKSIKAEYLFSKQTSTAYIELAKASGVALLKQEELNVMQTSTFGTGLQILHAISLGAKRIFIGLGGSATNDAAIGIAHALGYRFLDGDGNALFPRGANLNAVEKIISPKEPIFKDVQFYAINDVQNPFYGTKGAAFTYAKQKGASDSDIKLLDKGLRNISTVVKEQLGHDYADTPGAGAAGGTGYGLRAFLDARFIGGVDFIFELKNVQKLLNTQNIDAIITGEGRIDDQTAYGKLIGGVVAIAKASAIPVLAICGKLGLENETLQTLGLTAAEELYDPTKSAQYSFDHAESLVAKKAEQLVRNLLGS